MKDRERFHGSNPNGSTFDMRETPHGDWAVFVTLANGERVERYCSERSRAIDLLVKCKVISPEAAK